MLPKCSTPVGLGANRVRTDIGHHTIQEGAQCNRDGSLIEDTVATSRAHLAAIAGDCGLQPIVAKEAGQILGIVLG